MNTWPPTRHNGVNVIYWRGGDKEMQNFDLLKKIDKILPLLQHLQSGIIDAFSQHRITKKQFLFGDHRKNFSGPGGRWSSPTANRAHWRGKVRQPTCSSQKSCVHSKNKEANWLNTATEQGLPAFQEVPVAWTWEGAPASSASCPGATASQACGRPLWCPSRRRSSGPPGSCSSPCAPPSFWGWAMAAATSIHPEPTGRKRAAQAG